MLNENAVHVLQRAEIAPYDDQTPSAKVDWAHKTARGVLHDLSFRSGFRQVLEAIKVAGDHATCTDLAETLAVIIRQGEDLYRPVVPTDLFTRTLHEIVRSPVSLSVNGINVERALVYPASKELEEGILIRFNLSNEDEDFETFDQTVEINAMGMGMFKGIDGALNQIECTVEVPAQERNFISLPTTT